MTKPITSFNVKPHNLPNLVAQLTAMANSGEDWVVSAKLKQTSRSIQQNSRLWALYTALGLHIGETPDRMHELMGFKFLRELKTVNGEAIEVVKSTTKLTTAQMASYQESIERWANMELGFIFQYGE